MALLSLTELSDGVSCGSDLLQRLKEYAGTGNKRKKYALARRHTEPSLQLALPGLNEVIVRRDRRKVNNNNGIVPVISSTRVSSWPTRSKPAKPSLLIKLEQHIESELPFATNDDAKLRIYHEIFDQFIEAFPSYRPVLEQIKEAYDDQMTKCNSLSLLVDGLQTDIELAKANAANSFKEFEKKSMQAVDQAGIHAKEWQRAFEDKCLLIERFESDSKIAKKQLSDYQEKAGRDQSDKERLRVALQHITDVCSDLNQKIEAQAAHFRDQENQYKSQILIHEYKIETLQGEVDDFLKKTRETENKKKRTVEERNLSSSLKIEK